MHIHHALLQSQRIRQVPTRWRPQQAALRPCGLAPRPGGKCRSSAQPRLRSSGWAGPAQATDEWFCKLFHETRAAQRCRPWAGMLRVHSLCMAL